MTTTDRIRAIVDPLVDERGFAVYDVEQQGPTLRVTVAAGSAGAVPSIDDLSDLTRQLSRALDEDDPIPSRYTLEVSSPGLERVLRTPEHFEGAVGETVSVKLRRSDDGPRRIRGELRAATGDHVVVAEGDTETTIAYEDIDKARTIFEWGPTAKPGAGASGTQARTRRSTP